MGWSKKNSRKETYGVRELTGHRGGKFEGSKDSCPCLGCSGKSEHYVAANHVIRRLPKSRMTCFLSLPPQPHPAHDV